MASAPPPHAGGDALAVAAVTIKPNLKLMSNSERGKYYRRKHKLFAAELEASVAQLRRHVRELTASRQLQEELAVGLQHTPLGSLARLTREYYAMFEFGTPVEELPSQTVGAAPVRVAAVSPLQIGYLRAAMEERVGFGDFAGIALLVDQWERYSVYHSELWFELQSLEVRVPETPTEDDAEPPQPVIAVHAALHVRITRETIEQVFPHLIEEDDPLVAELTGLEIAYPCVNHFYFTADGKIARYDPSVDFLGAFMSKIRTLAGVTHLLDRARIAKDHMIGYVDDDDADASSSDAHKSTRAASPGHEDSDADISSVSSPDSVEVQADASSPEEDRLALDFILS